MKNESPIDIQSEGLLPLRDVPRFLAAHGGRRVHLSTIYRWVLAGVGGRTLETVKIGGQVYTSKAALQRFATPGYQEGGAE